MIQCFQEEFTNRFSTSSRLHRRAPDCLRFAQKAKKPTVLCCVITKKSYNTRNPSFRKTSYLTSKELIDAPNAGVPAFRYHNKRSMLKKLMASARRVRLLRTANCNFFNCFLTRKIIFFSWWKITACTSSTRFQM